HICEDGKLFAVRRESGIRDLVHRSELDTVAPVLRVKGNRKAAQFLAVCCSPSLQGLLAILSFALEVPAPGRSRLAVGREGGAPRLPGRGEGGDRAPGGNVPDDHRLPGPGRTSPVPALAAEDATEL